MCCIGSKFPVSFRKLTRQAQRQHLTGKTTLPSRPWVTPSIQNSSEAAFPSYNYLTCPQGRPRLGKGKGAVDLSKGGADLTFQCNNKRAQRSARAFLKASPATSHVRSPCGGAPQQRGPLTPQTQTRPNRLHTHTHPPKRLVHPRSPIPPLSTLTSRATHAHPTSPRSTGFCAIWDCISSSSRLAHTAIAVGAMCNVLDPRPFIPVSLAACAP